MEDWGYNAGIAKMKKWIMEDPGYMQVSPKCQIAKMDYGGSRLLHAILLLHHVQPLPFLWVGSKNMFLYIHKFW